MRDFLFQPMGWSSFPLPFTKAKLETITVEEFSAQLPGAIKKQVRTWPEVISSSLVPSPDQLKVGTKYFLPFQWISTGQVEVSFEYILEKLKEAIELGLLALNEESGEYELHLENGTVLFGEDRCGTGVVIGKKVYLNDGNTKAMTAILAGATNYCVEILENYPHDTLKDPLFRAKMIEKGYLFTWDDEGREVVNMPEWMDMKDHPGRTFMVKHRIKVKARLIEGEGLAIKIKGAEADYPQAIFLKINNDIPYLELKLWIAAIQSMASEEILSLGDSKKDIQRLINNIKTGIESGHPALRGMEGAFLIENYGEFKSTEDVEKAVQDVIYESCNKLLL